MAKVYIDAAARLNPMLAASSCVIQDEDETHEFSRCLGAVDNHEAEWLSYVHALDFCVKNQIKQVLVYTDSQIVVDSMDKRFVKNKKFKPYLNDVLSMEKHFDLMFVSHLARKENNRADKLAKEQLYKCLSEFQSETQG